jgi:putative nucleotidyltransferase with HDIG domain
MKESVKFHPGRHPQDFSCVRETFAIAERLGVPIYLVGGFLRDAIDVGIEPRHKTVSDFDFAVGGAVEPLALAVASALKGHYVRLDAENDITRIVLDSENYLDFAGYKGTMESDIWRRDFTINALAYVGGEEVIDLVGGLRDLRARRIRALGEEVLRSDPLRLLRAYRFAVLLEGEIEAATRSFVKSNLALLDRVAKERINYELFTMMDSPNVGRYIYDMGEVGLLEAIFPPLIDCRRVTANSFHHLALFEHSMETIPQIEARLPSMPDYVKCSLACQLGSGVSRLAATKVAALLHDIGKPGTWQVTPEGRHTFIAHDKLGASMVKTMAEGQKWSRALSRFIEKLVLLHLRPGQLFHTGTPTKKAINRFYRNVGEDVPELMLLAFADLGATRGPGLCGENRENLEQNLIELLHGFPVYLEESKKIPQLLNGGDVMKLLSLSPCPLVGEILLALSEAQEIKEVTDRAQAEAFVRDLYEKQKTER